jgi:hypothetical protein
MWEKKGNIFDEHHAQLPVVDEYEDFYRVYYSTRIDGKSTPLYFDIDINNPNIILNKCYEPIITLGNIGSFDWAGVMPTKIINYNNKKYLYYIGWSLRQDVPYHNNLGLAISHNNGNVWVKYSKGPIFHTSYEEPGFIGTVEILIENGVWRMWYLSCRNWINVNSKIEPIYDIKYAESNNGIDWKPLNIVCIPLENEEGGISSCRVIKFKSHYKMWYSVRNKVDYRTNPSNSYRIKTATSSDGIKWIKDQNIDLDISVNSTWDNYMVCYPFIVDKTDKLVMFYNGNDFGKTGIGYATKTIE